MANIVAAAADLTRRILGADPDRLKHSQAAARQAEFFAPPSDPVSPPLLIAAAWLHDIGYAPELRDTGFHPIDGARHLHNRLNTCQTTVTGAGGETYEVPIGSTRLARL